MEKNNKQNKEQSTKEEAPELVDEFEGMDIESLLPSMQVDDNQIQQNEEPKAPPVVEDTELKGLYQEIIDNCRKDREGADEILTNFLDMVMNDGDASSASKEAIVNLMKIKSDTSDKMSKVADLMTRLKQKEKDTFPKYLAAQQNNSVVIEGSKREMLKSINKLAQRNKT